MLTEVWEGLKTVSSLSFRNYYQKMFQNSAAKKAALLSTIGKKVTFSTRESLLGLRH